MKRWGMKWAAITTVCVVGCRAGAPLTLSRSPVSTTVAHSAAAKVTPSEQELTDASGRSQLDDAAEQNTDRKGVIANRVPLTSSSPASSIPKDRVSPEETELFLQELSAPPVVPQPAHGLAGFSKKSPESKSSVEHSQFNLETGAAVSNREVAPVAMKTSEDVVFPESVSDVNRELIQLTNRQVDAAQPDNLRSATTLPPSPMVPPGEEGSLLSIEQRIGEPAAHAGSGVPVGLSEVIQSIYQSYPLLEAAIFGRNIAAGEQLAAEGAYDLKLKAASENLPLGYYRNYRQSLGVEQELQFGGQVFGGYRLGRGEIQPWYQERVTNEGGEFMAGLMVPLAQNRAIDPRRAELWKATYGRSAVEPHIQSQLIMFVFGGSISYWDWVAAGQSAQYAEQLHALALARDAQLKELVAGGAMPESVVIDNQRLIVSRQVKLIETRQKLQQSAVKLSLFLRTPDGFPLIPTEDQLPIFPEPLPIDESQLTADIADALSRRPELRELDFDRRIAEIDLAQAHNLTQPTLDATFWGAQDVGEFSSSKGDKQPLELQGSVNFSMPLQRRSAQGKIRATEGKITQIQIKRKFTQDKIETEVRNATIALIAAHRALEQARRSVALNIQMQELETIQLEEGNSDLLRLNLREEQTFNARLTEVEAQYRYFEAQAGLRAAMGLDADGLSNLPAPAMP